MKIKFSFCIVMLLLCTFNYVSCQTNKIKKKRLFYSIKFRKREIVKFTHCEVISRNIVCSCILTRIFCKALTDWFWTGIPLISLISSPTWRVACLWIIPPCIIRATKHCPSSFIFNVIPCEAAEQCENRFKCNVHSKRRLLRGRRKGTFHPSSFSSLPCLTPAKCFQVSLTIGSSVFFWNCTSLTRVIFSSKSPFCPSRSSPPFRYVSIGGGVTLVASSP